MKYVTKGENVHYYEEGLTSSGRYAPGGEVVGRYETRGETVGTYAKVPEEEWPNPIGIQQMPTPDGWTPEWPVRGIIGPAGSYQSLPTGWGGCGACGGLGRYGADTSSGISTTALLIGAVAAVVLYMAWK